MSDTPRTDAAQKHKITVRDHEYGAYMVEMVTAEFARTLERELATLVAEKKEAERQREIVAREWGVTLDSVREVLKPEKYCDKRGGTCPMNVDCCQSATPYPAIGQ